MEALLTAGGKRGWGVALDIGRRVVRRDMRLFAAGIAFYLLLSLIPLLLLGTSAVGYVLGSSEEAVSHVLRAATRLVPRAMGTELPAVLEVIVGSRHITGALGVGMLLWLGLQVFEAIPESVRALTDGGPGRSPSYLRRKLRALVLMGTAGLLLLGALVGTWVVAAWPTVAAGLGVHFSLPWMLSTPEGSRYVAATLFGVLLVIVYWVAIGREIGWGAALGGGTVAAIIWHGGRLAINELSIYADAQHMLGPLNGLVTLVLWVYYTAWVVLAGGVVADRFHGPGVVTDRADPLS